MPVDANEPDATAPGTPGACPAPPGSGWPGEPSGPPDPAPGPACPPDAADPVPAFHDAPSPQPWVPTPDGPPSADGRIGAGLAEIVRRLGEIEGALGEFHRRAEHREAVIDRLHEERVEQRAGIRRALLDPTVVDLIRLHDGLAGESDRMARQGEPRTSGLLASFADDVELALERCGYELLHPQPGDPFVSSVQVAASVVPTDDPTAHNTVAEVVQVGVREVDSGRIRRPARTRVFRLRPSSPGDEPPTPAAVPAAVDPTGHGG